LTIKFVRAAPPFQSNQNKTARCARLSRRAQRAVRGTTLSFRIQIALVFVLTHMVNLGLLTASLRQPIANGETTAARLTRNANSTPRAAVTNHTPMGENFPCVLRRLYPIRKIKQGGGAIFFYARMSAARLPAARLCYNRKRNFFKRSCGSGYRDG